MQIFGQIQSAHASDRTPSSTLPTAAPLSVLCGLVLEPREKRAS